MALLLKKKGEIPDDAIILTEDQAIQYQYKIINNWKDQSEVWPFTYGAGLLGALSAATGVFINNHYRSKLKLGVYGRFSSYLPIVVLPAMISTLFHTSLIQPRIILQKDKCSVCLQTKAASIQIGLGVIYPMVLGPLASFMYATRHFTFRLPSITEQPKEVFKLYKKFTKSFAFPITLFVAAHFLLSSFITYKASESFYTIQLKLQELERKLESDSLGDSQD